MKTIQGVIIGAFAFLLGATCCIQAQLLTAEPDQLQPISHDALPRNGTFWLAKGPSGRPMPPYPALPPGCSDLPVYALGGGQFVVDDSQGALISQPAGPSAMNGVSYLQARVTQVWNMVAQAEEAQQQVQVEQLAWGGLHTQLSLNGEIISQDAGGSGPNGPSGFDPDVLHVESLTRSNGFLIFNIQGLIPGNTFLLARKTVLNDDLRNYWVPQLSFVATDTNQIVSIPFPGDSDAGFYLVVNYDLYQGPSPAINSPADNSTVSGTIHISASLTDIFPATQATLYVDGKNFGRITNGPMVWSLDTARLANGSHTVEVKVLSFIPFDPTTPSAWSSSAVLFNLNTSNALAENVAPRVFTAEFGTVPFAFDTADPAVVTVRVFGAAGTNIVWSTSLTNDPAGTCYPYWNLTDNLGNPVPLPSPDQTVDYRVVVTATPLNNAPPGAAGDSGTRIFTMNIGTDTHAGHTAVCWIPFDVIHSALGYDSKITSICNGTVGAVEGAHTIHVIDMDGWDRGINPNANPRAFDSEADFPYFYTILTNQMTGQFQFMADGDVDAFGAGPYAATACNSFIFTDEAVAQTLGNSLGYTNEHYTHRVRLANIESCLAGGGVLNFAFGTPDDVDANPALSKSAFVGWVTKKYITVPYLPDTPYGKMAKNWFGFWTNGGFDNGPGVRGANIQCLNFFGIGGLDAFDRTLGIHGSYGLRWQKTN